MVKIIVGIICLVVAVFAYIPLDLMIKTGNNNFIPAVAGCVAYGKSGGSGRYVKFAFTLQRFVVLLNIDSSDCPFAHYYRLLSVTHTVADRE